MRERLPWSYRMGSTCAFACLPTTICGRIRSLEVCRLYFQVMSLQLMEATLNGLSGHSVKTRAGDRWSTGPGTVLTLPPPLTEHHVLGTLFKRSLNVPLHAKVSESSKFTVAVSFFLSFFLCIQIFKWHHKARGEYNYI